MSLIIALLKINTTLTLCYGLYYFLLRKLTFYNLNRVFFLCAIMLSVLMPFIHIELERAPVKTLELQDVGTAYTIQVPNRDAVRFADFIPVLFWAGVILMGLRLLLQLFSVGRLYLRSHNNRIDGTAVRIMQGPNNPFSFFKSIFINPGLLPQEELHMVLRHEKVHARQWHSLDILLGELNKTMCWFNPAAWLMMRAIRQNLEFIADREVLKNGIAPKAYQYSLLRVSQSGLTVTLTSNFNFSHLKTRIIMMNKQHSKSIHLMKYLTTAPLTLALICCFGISSGHQKGVTMQPETQEAPLATTNDQAAFTHNSAASVPDKKPLILIDGERSYLDIESIDPKSVDTLTVLKQEKEIKPYVDQYGEEAWNGVLLIVTKKP